MSAKLYEGCPVHCAGPKLPDGRCAGCLDLRFVEIGLTVRQLERMHEQHRLRTEALEKIEEALQDEIRLEGSRDSVLMEAHATAARALERNRAPAAPLPWEALRAAAKFKAFVHGYLDQHGVPHGDPENPHQKEGCRIGARLDLLFAQRDAAEATAAVRASGDPAVRGLLLRWFGTTDPDLLLQAFRESRAHLDELRAVSEAARRACRDGVHLFEIRQLLERMDARAGVVDAGVQDRGE